MNIKRKTKILLENSLVLSPATKQKLLILLDELNERELKRLSKILLKGKEGVEGILEKRLIEGDDWPARLNNLIYKENNILLREEENLSIQADKENLESVIAEIDTNSQ